MAQIIRDIISLKRFIFIFFLLSMICGCWYSFSDKPFPQIESIGMIPLENNTPEYDIAADATDYLTQKLSSGSAYILAEPSSADGVITGSIISYTRKVNTYDENEEPVDYIVKVKARITFTQRNNDKQLWETVFEGYSVFAIGGDETLAKQEAVKMLVERIYEKLKSG